MRMKIEYTAQEERMGSSMLLLLGLERQGEPGLSRGCVEASRVSVEADPACYAFFSVQSETSSAER